MLPLASCSGFIAQGGSAAPGRTAQRASAPRATEQAGFFLLSKLDLAQVRAEREVLEKTLDEIDRNVAGAGAAASTLAEQAMLAPAPVQEAVAGGDPGLLASVASFFFHPIAPLLPIPVAVVPAAALYFFVIRPEGGGLLDGLTLPKFPGAGDAEGTRPVAAEAVEVDAEAAAAAAEAVAAADAKKKAEQIERTERTVRQAEAAAAARRAAATAAAVQAEADIEPDAAGGAEAKAEAVAVAETETEAEAEAEAEEAEPPPGRGANGEVLTGIGYRAAPRPGQPAADAAPIPVPARARLTLILVLALALTLTRRRMLRPSRYPLVHA